MASPTVTLGGREWHLRYDMNAIAELESALNRDIREIGLRIMRGKLGMRECRALVWAGILHEFEDAGIRQVGDWLNEAGFLKETDMKESLMAKVFDALSGAFPDKKPTEGSEDPKN